MERNMIYIPVMKKRIIAFFIVLVLTISQSGYLSLIEVYGETDDSGQPEIVSVLAFTSDVHNKRRNVAAHRLGTWIDKTKSKYGRIDAMCFCGDMASAMSKRNYWKYTGTVMKTAERKIGTVLYTTGNHEYSHRYRPGAYRPGLNKYTKKFIEDAQGLDQDHFCIYCMGSSSYTAQKRINRYSIEQIEKLTAYLSEIGNEKPIIIITHYPLHLYGKRTVKNANLLIDALNSAAVGDPEDATDDKKIVFLWGHNHSLFDVNYDQIFEPGDDITYAEGNSKVIRFYYGAAGCMSDKEYSNGSASVSGKGLVITIDSKHMLKFAYYNEKGFDVTEEGALTEKDPEMDISNPIQEPKQGVLLPCMTVKRGKKLCISWNKVREAEGYDVFLGEGKDPQQLQLIQSLSGNQWITPVLKKHTLYQAVVKAYIMQDDVKTYIRTSPAVYAYTSGGTKKLTNPECVTVKKSRAVIKAGQTYKIKASVRKMKKRKKLVGKGLTPKLRYVSSDTSVAEVSRSGRVTAKNAGTCMIYVCAVNGVRKGVAVTVK